MFIDGSDDFLCVCAQEWKEKLLVCHKIWLINLFIYMFIDGSGAV